MRSQCRWLLLSAVLSLAPVAAHAQAPLLSTFGGPVGFGSNNLPGNDDGSTSVLDLTAAFPGGLNFFGGPYTEVYVNNNGNITFNGNLYQYTSEPFPVADQPMIAPYWADVDTRGGGAPNNNGVFWHFEPGRMVVTWHNVGYYNTHDDLKMDFQLILSNSLDCRGGDFDVEFRYNRCEWTTGDASSGSGGFGGTPAQAGFDAGNGVDFVEIMGSRTMAILDLCTTSNVGTPGVWRFSVRGGAVSCPGTGDLCDTGMTGACGVGVTQCVGRDTVCAQIGVASEERCDGIDNDCNGDTDEGAELCETPNVCVEGSCVPRCFEGGCGNDETCTAGGLCVETSCIDVDCPSNQRCSGGVCVGACADTICPHGQQCIAGRCADLCNILTCASDEVCVEGACVPECPCRSCNADEICGADGACTPVGCDITVCEPGFYCRSGECLDACAGAICPAGQHCAVGECVDGVPEPPITGTDSGVAPGTDGGPSGMVMDGGIGADSDTGGPDPRGSSSPGCGCRVESTTTPKAAWPLALIALALVWRRRSGSR